MIQLSRNYSLPERAEEEIPIKVVGLGGAGSNALDRIVLDGLEKAQLIAINTDVQSLASSVAAHKVQLGSAMVMYGRIPRIAAPSWIGALHRWSGRVAVLHTVPVAVHCLYALGLESGSVRVLVHSLLGCFFYGAFVAKMLVLNRHDTPGWTLPVLGGAVFTALTALWLTSSVWFFTTTGITF